LRIEGWNNHSGQCIDAGAGSPEDIMKLRNLVLGLILATSPAMASDQEHPQGSQQDGWQPYAIGETGAHVDVPTAIFSKDAGPPESGSGRRFLTSDGRANLTVQTLPNQDGDSPAAFLAKIRPPSGIVYKRVTPNFFVVSSVRDQIIWYNRCNFSGRLAHCILINYPADEKRQWDRVVTRISNTLASR
jgi:hypothetical protein